MKVIPHSQMYSVVREVHEVELKHGGYKKVMDLISKQYACITRPYMQEFCATCPTCQLRHPQKSRPPLRPIVESSFLARIQVDLISMEETPDDGFKYICHVEDHFSKFHVIFPLQTKTAVEVAQGLQERYLSYFGPPRIFHTDNGREFVNSLLPALIAKWEGDVTFVKVS